MIDVLGWIVVGLFVLGFVLMYATAISEWLKGRNK